MRAYYRKTAFTGACHVVFAQVLLHVTAVTSVLKAVQWLLVVAH